VSRRGAASRGRNPAAARGRPLMVELCSGYGVVAAAFRARKWLSLTVDVSADHRPDIVADIRDWRPPIQSCDFLWASPPCEEFVRSRLPWLRPGSRPDMSIWDAVSRLIVLLDPPWAIIENSRYAGWFVGPPAAGCFPFCFWGTMPAWPQRVRRHRKSNSHGHQPAKRARIPEWLAEQVADIIDGAYLAAISGCY
jgi:hypothetical protein